MSRRCSFTCRICTSSHFTFQICTCFYTNWIKTSASPFSTFFGPKMFEQDMRCCAKSFFVSTYSSQMCPRKMKRTHLHFQTQYYLCWSQGKTVNRLQSWLSEASPPTIIEVCFLWFHLLLNTWFNLTRSHTHSACGELYIMCKPVLCTPCTATWLRSLFRFVHTDTDFPMPAGSTRPKQCAAAAATQHVPPLPQLANGNVLRRSGPPQKTRRSEMLFWMHNVNKWIDLPN